MKTYIRNSIVRIIVIIFFCGLGCGQVRAENIADDTGNYRTKVFTSEDGLEGTAVNCICPSEEGFLWIGGYAGLFRYDGNEFKKYLIQDKTLPVNDIVQDHDGNLWIGTNGDGVYSFDGEQFCSWNVESEKSGLDVINELYIDSEDQLWIGTKSGLFKIELLSENHEAEEIQAFTNSNIREITEIEDGRILVINKEGIMSEINHEEVSTLELPQLSDGNVPRCCVRGTDGFIYIGTTGNQILKINESEGKADYIDGQGLSSINDIYEIQTGQFWVCTDSGIGLLKDDRITEMVYPLGDSVEKACTDFQGNFWFVSSRQGLLEVYENPFSDLKTYPEIDQPVNSIMEYGNDLYVGCDNGLICFHDQNRNYNQLTEICEGMRIRQLYKDSENNLWVSTYYEGIIRMDGNGEIVCLNSENSGLTTNQIRCIWQRENGEKLVGTEKGVFLIRSDDTIRYLIDDPDFNNKRILDVKESKEGRIYAATDGYGVYVIENNKITSVYTKEQGLQSNIVMKMVPSERLNGVWLVTGIGLSFIDHEGMVSNPGGKTISNVLDILLMEDGNAVVLAGNGLFKVKEQELLEQEAFSYEQFERKDGLPVDFTANSWSTIQNGVLYMCGTTGMSSMEIDKKFEQKPIRLYVNGILEDDKSAGITNDELVVPSDTYRLTLDIRYISYIYQDFYISYYMEGFDKEPTIIPNDDKTMISYTNLKGGNYKYNLKILNPDNQECLAEVSFTVKKNYKLWEEPRVRELVILLLMAMVGVTCALLILYREKRIRAIYQRKYQKEKEKEIAKLAYQDLVTGVYNRNCFEEDKKKIKPQRVNAVVLASINYSVYLKEKYGTLYLEDILRKGVQILSGYEEGQYKIYRISENIFCLLFFDNIQLDQYIAYIKQKLKETGEDMGGRLSFAVGAVYNNMVYKETIDDLIERCDRMRLLDEKRAEAEFIEGKVKLI